MFNIESTTVNKEQQGVWIPFKGSEFLIASSNSLRFQRAFARLQRPYKKKIDKGTLDPKTQLEIMCRSLAETALLGWKNVQNSKGEIVEFSVEVAEAALTNNSEFRSFVVNVASDDDNFIDEEEISK